MTDYETEFENAIENIEDWNIKARLVGIKNLLAKKIEIYKDFKIKKNKLDAKYNEHYRSIYEKRMNIIDGGLDKEDSNEKGIPEFWLKCFENTRFGYNMNSKDREILKNLKNVNVIMTEDGSFTLFFIFDKNQYFNDEVLKLEFITKNDKLSQIISSKIIWNSDELNPKLTPKTKNRKKKKLDRHTDSPYESIESFFNLFNDVQVFDDDFIISNEYTNKHFEDGIFIKNELIPNALEFYLGTYVDEYEIDEESILS